MRISTLSVGDELICGQVTDTNAGKIANELIKQGLRVLRHMAVGDIEPDIIGALLDLSRSSDAIIVTGGLGPTADDITSQAAARATGRQLIQNSYAEEHVREKSSRIDSLMSCPMNDKQSMIPEEAILIPNPSGTACGYHLKYNGCFMIFIPGVPSEMIRMLHDFVIPHLTEMVTDRRIILMEHLNVFGPCEAEVDEMLSGIAQPDLGLYLGICVTFPWMRVTLRVEANSNDKAAELLDSATRSAQKRLQKYIFSKGEKTIDEAVSDLFLKSNMTLALAESCTGGMIAQRITSIPGCSRYFLEGSVTYSNVSKAHHLGVDATLLAMKGAVSDEVALAMAKGIRFAAGSDLGLAVTGIAGPEGGTDDKPIGTVFVSLDAPDGCWTKRFQFYGCREEIRIITTWTALDWLRRYLSGELICDSMTNI